MILLTCLLILIGIVGVISFSLLVDEDETRVVGSLFFAVTLCIGGLLGGIHLGERINRVEAAKAGAGRYESITNHVTGEVETKFVWTKAKEVE